MKKVAPLCLVGIAFFILSCNNSAKSDNTSADSSAMMTKDNGFDLNKARATIEDATKKFSEEYKNGDSVALAGHYTSDALLMPQNSEAVKKEGLVSAWAAFIRSGIKELRLTVQDVAGNNEMLTETGVYGLYGDNNKMLDQGKYVVVWKNENGEWKIFRDIFNTNLPLPK